MQVMAIKISTEKISKTWNINQPIDPATTVLMLVKLIRIISVLCDGKLVMNTVILMKGGDVHPFPKRNGHFQVSG